MVDLFSLEVASTAGFIKVRDSGGVVTARIAEAPARGIAKSYKQSILAEYGDMLL